MALGLGIGLGFSRGGGFDPSQISGLVLWEKANDLTTITDTSGAVDEWRDKSGNGNDADGTTTTRPQTGARTVNGKNALDFARAQSERLVIPNSADFNVNQDFTIFIAGVTDDAATTTNLFLAKFQNNLGEDLRIYHTTAGGMSASYGTNATTNVIVSTSAAVTDGSVFIGGIGHTHAGEFGVFLNGSDPANAALGVSIHNSTQPVYIGNERGTSTLFDGAMCEILWFNRRLTQAEMDSVGNYLKAQWGGTWYSQSETELTVGAGQSNMSRPLQVGNGFNKEGETEYLSGLSSYFSKDGIYDGAFNRSAILEANTIGNWWIDNDLTDGVALTGLISNLDSSGEVVTPLKYWDSVIWAGGDADIQGIKAGSSTKAEVKAAFEQLVTRFRELMDGANGAIVIALNGRYTNADMDDASAQAVRDMFIEVAAADPNIHTVEAWDAELSDSTHWDVASATTIFGRFAEKVAFARGKRPEAGTLGPIITSATYSGTTVTAQVELDNGSAITGSEVGQFRIEDDGVAVTINSLSINGTTVTFTLSSAIASGSVVRLWCNYGMGASVTVANLVKDANGYVMRSVSELAVTEA